MARDDLRDIGVLGEAEFRAWCARNNLLCNKSDPDKMGWDFFVEFPSSTNQNSALDSQNDLKKALVQVKASSGDRRTVRGKTSAFKRLVDADLPAFVATLRYDINGKVLSARLLHIGREMISLILEKVRRAEAAGNIDLHKILISLSLDGAGEINPDGSNLRKVLEDHIGPANSEYLIKKIGYRRSCGYEERAFRMKASFEGTPETLADFLIGKEPKLIIRKGSIEKRRFGIVLSNDITPLARGVMSMSIEKSSAITRISVSNKIERTTVEVEANILSTAQVNLPKSLRRLRVHNDFLDLVFNYGTRSLQIEFLISPEKNYEILELSKRLQVGYLLSQQGTILALQSPGIPKIEIPLPAPIAGLSDHAVLQSFIGSISAAFQRFRPGANFRVTFSEAASAHLMNRTMFAIITQPGFKATIRESIAQKVEIISKIVFSFLAIIPFKDVSYLAIAEAEAAWSYLSDGSIEAIGDAPNIVWEGIEDGQDHMDLVKEQAKKLAGRHVGNVMILTLELAE
jgi:hypothetical protein